MKSLKKRILPFAMTAAVLGVTMVMGNLVTSAHAMNPCEGLSGCSTSGAFDDEKERGGANDDDGDFENCLRTLTDQCKRDNGCSNEDVEKSDKNDLERQSYFNHCWGDCMSDPDIPKRCTWIKDR